MLGDPGFIHTGTWIIKDGLNKSRHKSEFRDRATQ